MPAFKKELPIRLSKPIPRLTSVISAPTLSQILETALIKEILAASKELEGLKYLDRTLESSNRIYQLFREGGGYNMPELEKPLSYLSGSGFRQVLLEDLRDDGTIDDSTYRQINNDLRKSVKGARAELASRVIDYSMYTPQKVAAAFLGIFGVGILVGFGRQITGGAIGVSESNIAGAVAGLMLLS